MRHNFKKVGKSKFMSDGTLHYCEEAEANAKLIAAAPDLLEALNNIVEYWNTPQSSSKSAYDHMNHIFLIADKAIKKATE